MTPRQRQTLDFIGTFIDTHGYSPSYAEIAEGIGLSIKSRGAVCAIVHLLAKDGHVRLSPDRTRTIVLAPVKDDLSGVSAFDLACELKRRGIYVGMDT